MGGEMMGEVTCDEVVGDPYTMALKGEDRKGRRGLEVLKLITEGLGIMISYDVKLFSTGKFLKL